MSLYLKYRPGALEDLYGNQNTIAEAEGILESKDRAHAYLIQGDTGCGKTTLGRIIATKVGCKGADFREVDSADFRGIDTIREIRKQMQFKPLEGTCRVWLIDECHQLSKDAQNALLKALEDTPKHVYFILCTTDPQKLLPTIRSRCYQLTMHPLSDSEMKKLLRFVVRSEQEKLQKAIYEQIIQDGQGRPREALQILSKVLSVPDEKRLAVAEKAGEAQSQTIDLCRALTQGAPWKKTANILTGLKEEDPERIRRAVLGYCSTILLKGENHAVAGIMEEFIEPFYSTGFPGLVYACYSALHLE